MKRSGEWPRRKRLQAKAELRNTTPFESGRTPLTAGPKRVALVNKRPTVTPEERRARKLLSTRSAGLCEMCGSRPATDAHHRLNRSQGGRWETVNLLHLCRSDHRLVTVNPALGKSRGWCVASFGDPATAPVWLAVRGWSLLRPDGSVTPYNREAA